MVFCQKLGFEVNVLDYRLYLGEFYVVRLQDSLYHSFTHKIKMDVSMLEINKCVLWSLVRGS